MSSTRSNLIVGLLIGLVLASGLFAGFLATKNKQLSAEGSTPPRQLKIAHSLPIKHPVHQGIQYFADRLKALSGGRITCAIYPSEQLGNETVCLEKLQNGTLDFTKVSAAPVSNFVPVIKVFSLPYLFDDELHFWETLDSKIGTALLKEVSTQENGDSSNLVGLCYFDSGSRNFYSKEPIKTPKDIEGKTVRVMRDAVAIAMVEAMGGNPTPMAFGELYSALEQGNVDAAENNPPSFVNNKHHEVCKYFTYDHHSRIPDLLLASSNIWSKLSEQEKEWVRTAAREASVYQRKLWKIGTKECEETMVKNGVQIYRPDLKPFQKAVAPVIKEFSKGKIADYVKQIQK